MQTKPLQHIDDALKLAITNWVDFNILQGNTNNLSNRFHAIAHHSLCRTVMEHTEDNQSRAALALGINRNTLHVWLKKGAAQ